jgi:serine protease AprX
VKLRLMGVRALLPVLAFACVLALPTVALGKNSDDTIDSSVDIVLAATDNEVAVPVIVEAPGALDLVRGVIPLGVDVTDIPMIGSLAAYLTPEEIATLGDKDFVTQIVADNQVHGFDYAATMDVTNLSIGLGGVAAPDAQGPTGAGVGVAVLDSGVSVSSDLGASRIVGWKDFINDRTTPYDDAGHGTFVAGLIAGDGSASLPLGSGGYATTQFRGVAPAANIVGVKVLDEVGQGRTSDLIAGIAWTIAHKNAYNVRVMNLSVGGSPVGPVSKDPIAWAVEAAWRAGITVVCAAGNEGDYGPGGILSPGDDPFVLTVGAVDTKQTASTADDSVASYISVGPTLFDKVAKPDVVAPGQRLISVRTPGSYLDVNFPANIIPLATYAPTSPAGTDSRYLMLSGTSAAAPVVAGAAALMIGQEPSLTPDDVKVRLMSTADPVTGATAGQQGAGMIDVDHALSSTAHATGWALSPTVDTKKKVFSEGDYNKWQKRSWEKYGWTNYRWTNYRWTNYRWTNYRWTKVAWTNYRWTNYRWTEYDWAIYRWTILLNGQ